MKREREREDIAVISSNGIFEIVRIENKTSQIFLRLIDCPAITAVVLLREMY